MSRRVAVVGGGVSGLTAAFELRERAPELGVTVFEASPRAGGWLRTETVDDLIIDRGPDSILTQKPYALDLVKRLGIEDQVISTASTHRGAYVVRKGTLQRIPEGFAVVGPGALGPMLRSPLLSWAGKLRAACEPWVPVKAGDEDESVAAFVERRFGREVLERLAQPIAGGIYGGRPQELSAPATLGRYVAFEREFGSVMRGLQAAAKTGEGASGAHYGLFINFKRGMQTLPDALVAKLDGCVELEQAVQRVDADGAGWRLQFADRDERFDAVILALPAHGAAAVLDGSQRAVATALRKIPFGDGLVVTLAFERDDVDHPLDAFGFVVPETERRAALASTWSSVKWPGRAPDDRVLLRVFLVDSDGATLTDRANGVLIASARRELQSLLGLDADPILSRVDRFSRAMPRYQLGHRHLVATIDTELAAHPTLALAGNSLHGVGIPDAIASGQAAAARLLGAL